MATLYNSDLKPLASGEYTHYYDHATKLFLADNYRLAPKQKFLYYVRINISQEGWQSILPISVDGRSPASSQTLIEQYETGLMAKRVELPRFNIETRTLKAYNRKNVFQTGIKYDPVNITFHDDAADTVTKFWNDFYTYYYRDSDYDSKLYGIEHKYEPRTRQGWGFTPRNNNTKPFLQDIQIFSLHNKRFTEYMLINPIISAWRHGEHESSASNELMDSTMTVEFETVKYRTGYVNPVDVNGFAVIHYDNTPSPISESTTNIFTDAGLVGVLGEGSTDLSRPDNSGSGAGILGSVLDATRFYNNLKDTNFNQLAKITLGQVGAQILGGTINGAFNEAFFPTQSGSAGYGSSYGSSQVGQQASQLSASPASQSTFSSAATINGQAAAFVAGAGLTLLSSNNNDYNRGVTTPGSKPANPGSTALYGVLENTNSIQLGSDGQPETGKRTTYKIDSSTGEPIAEFQAVGTQSGSYDSSNLQLNLRYTQEVVDQNGQILRKYVYVDGTIVTRNQAGQQISIEKGEATNPKNINTNPTNARELILQGKNVSDVETQFYTNANTATTTVTTAVTATVAEIPSSSSGGVSAVIPSSSLPSAETIISQPVSRGINGTAGSQIGIGQTIEVQVRIDPFTGTPTQGAYDGKIVNITVKRTGDGTYQVNAPNLNTITIVDNQDGTVTINTIDGGSTTVNALDLTEISRELGPYLLSPIDLSSPGQNQDLSALGSLPGQGVATDAYGNSIPLAPSGSSNPAWNATPGNQNVGPSYDDSFQQT